MIKPCPFCGSAQPMDPEFEGSGEFSNHLYLDGRPAETTWEYYQVKCINCGALGPVASSEAIAALGWDERFPLQPEPGFKPEPDPEDGSGSMRG